MSDARGNGPLSERERLAIRRALRARDGGARGRIARLGRVLTHPRHEQADVRRYRFGIAMVGFAIFQMALVAVLPNDDRRWIFFGFAWLTLFVGARHIDKSRTKRAGE